MDLGGTSSGSNVFACRHEVQECACGAAGDGENNPGKGPPDAQSVRSEMNHSQKHMPCSERWGEGGQMAAGFHPEHDGWGKGGRELEHDRGER